MHCAEQETDEIEYRRCLFVVYNLHINIMNNLITIWRLILNVSKTNYYDSIQISMKLYIKQVKYIELNYYMYDYIPHYEHKTNKYFK